MKPILWRSVFRKLIIYKRIIFALLVMIVLVMLEEIFDTLLEFLDIAYESISFILEELIQHFFHVSKYLSQSIVFYLWLSAALLVSYHLWRKLPGLLERLKNFMHFTWSQLTVFWLELTLSRKLVFVMLCAMGFYLYLSFFF
ncbi:MAG: hypothetical protein ACU83N_01830 [Gammaproteobacteria bacterium]